MQAQVEKPEGHPRWLERVVSDQGLEKIQNSVEKAELTTSGEIVPMIAHRSVNTGHVPLMLFLIHVLVLWSLVPYLAPTLPQVPLWVIEVIAVALAALLAFLQRRVDFWSRFLTTTEDQALSVMRRAQLEFYHSDIKQTEGKTGVLIFVSLLERRAVVLADKAVADHFPPSTWEEIIAALVSRVKDGDFAGGMSEAVENVGRLLGEQFPIAPGDRNELPNHLIVKE